MDGRSGVLGVAWTYGREPEWAVYENFGSITVMTKDQLTEFAWGLANSNHHFLQVIGPDLVKGDTAVLPPKFMTETKESGLIASWCMQARGGSVLNIQRVELVDEEHEKGGRGRVHKGDDGKGEGEAEEEEGSGVQEEGH